MPGISKMLNSKRSLFAQKNRMCKDHNKVTRLFCLNGSQWKSCFCMLNKLLLCQNWQTSISWNKAHSRSLPQPLKHQKTNFHFWAKCLECCDYWLWQWRLMSPSQMAHFDSHANIRWIRYNTCQLCGHWISKCWLEILISDEPISILKSQQSIF